MLTTNSAPAEQFDDMEQQLRADLMGMWVFLGTEVLLFGSLLTAFALLRIQHAGVFADAAHHLDLLMGSINTAVLMASGLAVALAEQTVNRARRGATLKFLAAAMVLGLVFLLLKFHAWYVEYKEGLMPVLGLEFRYDGEHDHIAELFFNLYYLLTGLHALHMMVGLGVLITITNAVRRWRDPGRAARQVRIGGLYWAFVDVVWVFIFTSLYLLRN